IRHQEFESLTVYTFEAPASLGAAGIMGVKQKVATAYGAGFNVAILHAPNTNEKGEPLLGTVHPTQFEVVTFPADEPPNISSAQTSSDEAQYAISAALSMAVDAFGGGGAEYRAEEHTSALQPRLDLACRLRLETNTDRTARR